MTESSGKDVELNKLVKQLEELNKKFQEITQMTGEAIHRIFPDTSISESKAKDEAKLSTGYVGEIQRQILAISETVERSAYNLSRLQKIA